MNSLSGLQVLAISGLQQGEGLAIPDVSANIAVYDAFTPVNKFLAIFAAAPNAALTDPNKTALQYLGANAGPFLFGTTPFNATDNIGPGPLFPSSQAQIEMLFGNVNSSSIFVQIVNSAQAYVSSCADALNSAASATWNGNVQTAVSGGISAICGNNETAIKATGNAFLQLGDLINFQQISAGFSAAALFKKMLNEGNNTIGNLHLNLFGKMIIDPSDGKSYVINADTLQMIIDNPVAPGGQFPIVALNPLELQLRQLADAALWNTRDLDAVITYIGITGSAATSIEKFSDCLSPELMLSTAKFTFTPLTTWNLLFMLASNVNGLSNLKNCVDLGNLFLSIKLLGDLNLLTARTSPVDANIIANLAVSLGPGSGANGNPTVADVVGSTNIAGALSDSIIAVGGYVGNSIYSNISSDISNLATVVTGGWSGSASLSDGSTYTDANAFCTAASALINLNANLLVENTEISSYNFLATTLNNSKLLLPKAGINVATYSNSVSSLVDFGSTLPKLISVDEELSGLTNVIQPVIDNTLTGQALNASLIEEYNNQVLGDFGIASTSHQPGV